MFNKDTKDRVVEMRKVGKSYSEIHLITQISMSNLSLWLRDVPLDKEAKERIILRRKEGSKKAGIALSKKRVQRESEAKSQATDTLKNIPTSTKHQKKLMCALIYYCEGSKSIKNGMTFTNSDPDLMRTFLSLLRDGFDLDESRFRVCAHLHSYHKEKIQKAFWSKVMSIPESKFIKSFIKQESGINKKEGYPGCATLRYHDASVARELLEIARQYFLSRN